MSVYIASYYRQYSPNITTRDLLLIIPLWAMYKVPFYPFSAMLQRRFHSHLYIYIYIYIYRPLVIGVLGISLCMFMCAITTNPYVFIILFATGFGILDGMSFVNTLVLAGKYFPFKLPIINGLLFAGLGIGAFSFSFIAQAIVNPENKKPTIEVTDGAATDYYYTNDVYDNVIYIYKYIYI